MSAPPSPHRCVATDASDGPSPDPRLAGFARLGLVVLSAVAGALALEIPLRALLAVRDRLRPPLVTPRSVWPSTEDEPVLLWRNKRSFELPTSTGVFRINAAGMRSMREVTAAKPPGTIRVAIVGGSAALGFGASSNQRTWPHLMEAGLARALGSQVEVLNGAVQGYVSFQELLVLTGTLVHFAPDLVLIYDGFNDASVFSAAAAGPAGPGEPSQVPRSLELARIIAQVHHPPPLLALGRMVRSLAIARLMGRLLGPGHTKSAASDVADQPRSAARLYREEVVDTYVGHVRSMVAIARAHGAVPAIVLQPMTWRVMRSKGAPPGAGSPSAGTDTAGPLFNRYFDEFDRRLSTLCGRMGVDYLDGSRLLQAQQVDTSMFQDPVHLTDDASVIIARQMTAWIAGVLRRRHNRYGPATLTR